MYEAASLNHREVEKALTQLERSVTSAIRRNDDPAVRALARLQLLTASVKAEARLLKIAYMPDGLRPGERRAVLDEADALQRWKAIVDTAFRRHYRVPRGQTFAESLDHDTLAKHATLHELIEDELRPLILLRNKLAHGQWIYPFNADLNSIERAALKRLNGENTLTVRFRDRLLVQLGNIVVDVAKSGPSIEARFNEYFVRIRRYRKLLADADYDQWCIKVRATSVSLGRVQPVAMPEADDE